MSALKKTFRIGDWDVSRLEPNTFYRIYKHEHLGTNNYGEIIILRDADRKGVCYKATTRLIKYLNNTPSAKDCDGEANFTFLTKDYKTFKNSQGKTIKYLDLECHSSDWRPDF